MTVKPGAVILHSKNDAVIPFADSEAIGRRSTTGGDAEGITGKPMKGWVLVGPEGVEDDEQLKNWIQQAVKFVGKLPGKEK